MKYLKLYFQRNGNLQDRMKRLSHSKFKVIRDQSGTEFVVYKSSSAEKTLRSITIKDRTAFEAVENHVHISDWENPKEMQFLIEEGKKLCISILVSLKNAYPTRDFSVYLTFTFGDSVILRFHQIWEGEFEYYASDAIFDDTIVIKAVSFSETKTMYITNGFTQEIMGYPI